jgi:hypothetical protein
MPSVMFRLTVFSINSPLTCRFDMFTRHDRGRATDDGHQVPTTLDLNLENGKTALGVMKGDPFDQSFEGFGHGGLSLTTLAAFWQGFIGPNTVLPLPCSSKGTAAERNNHLDSLEKLGKPIALPGPGADRTLLLTIIWIKHRHLLEP